MFTLEIDGKAVAITNGDREQAEELFHSDDFKDDLKTLTSDGHPLWNGTSALTVRPASQDEEEAFDEALQEDEDEDVEEEDEQDEEADEDEEDEDGVDVMFLIDLDEEEEDDD